MKKIILPVILLLITICASAQNRAETIRQKLLTRDTTTVIVTAHRGDWRNFPENSIAAIVSAAEMGVDIVEIDIQQTKDGQLILMHDPTLDRTTTGKGKIADWTLDSIRTLRLKNGVGIKTKHKVPTLEEALLAAKGKIMLNLDKADRYFDQVYDLLKKTGTTQQIVMKGTLSASKVKDFYGKYLQDVIYMPIINLDKPNAYKEIEIFLKDFQPVAFELLFTSDTNTLPLQLKNELKGKTLIWYNTLWDTMAGGHDDDLSIENIENGYGYLIHNLGAHIIQTDRPRYLLSYLRQHQLHP